MATRRYVAYPNTMAKARGKWTAAQKGMIRRYFGRLFTGTDAVAKPNRRPFIVSSKSRKNTLEYISGYSTAGFPLIKAAWVPFGDHAGTGVRIRWNRPRWASEWPVFSAYQNGNLIYRKMFMLLPMDMILAMDRDTMLLALTDIVSVITQPPKHIWIERFTLLYGQNERAGTLLTRSTLPKIITEMLSDPGRDSSWRKGETRLTGFVQYRFPITSSQYDFLERVEQARKTKGKKRGRSKANRGH